MTLRDYLRTGSPIALRDYISFCATRESVCAARHDDDSATYWSDRRARAESELARIAEGER